MDQKIVQEHRSIFALQISKELGTDKRMRKNAHDLVLVFQKHFEKEFDEPLIINRRHATAMMKRAYVWSGESDDAVEEIILFLLDNWTRIKTELNWQGKPSIRMFGSAAIFTSLKEWKENGFRQSEVKARFSEDESPDRGW